MSVYLLSKVVAASVPAVPPKAHELHTPAPRTPIVFPSTELQLSPEEEAFFESMLYNSRLTPNLTLFDLLFFDLHTEITTLKHVVKEDDFNRIIANLECCYSSKDVNGFLRGVVLAFINGNNAKHKPLNEGERIVAAGDTKLILQTLHRRVELFKKFSEHSELFEVKLSTLANNDRITATTNDEIQEIFEKNSQFLSVVYESLLKTTPALANDHDACTALVETVKSCCHLHKDTGSKEIPSAKKIIANSAQLYHFPVFMECVEYYEHIVRTTLISLQERHDRLEERSILMGQLPPQQVRSLTSFDAGDLLAAFRADRSIEPTFELTKEESALLLELFKYPLASSMTALDVLGFAMYERMERLKLIHPHFEPIITKYQGRVSAQCLSLYIGLYRSSQSEVEKYGSTNTFSEDFAMLPTTAEKWFMGIFEGFKAEINRVKVSKKQQKSKEEVLTQLSLTVLPVRDLFLKLTKAHGAFKLLLQAASVYRGGDALGLPSPHGRRMVQLYYDFVRNGYQTGAKKKIFGLQFDVFEKGQKSLPISNPPLEEEINSFGTHIAKTLVKLYMHFRKEEEDIDLVRTGKLNHKKWCKRERAPLITPKTDPAFVEQLYSNSTLTTIFTNFLSDLLLLVETRIYPEGTVSTRDCFYRLQFILSKSHPQGAACELKHVPASTSSKVGTLVERIQDELSKHNYFLNDMLFSHAATAGEFDHTTLLIYLIPVEKSLIATFEQTLNSLKSLKTELLQELEEQWSHYSLEELEQINVAEVKEAIFKEGLRLMRPILILSDMLALLQKRHYIEEAAFIPVELADLMQLDEVRQVRKKLRRAKTPKEAVVISQTTEISHDPKYEVEKKPTTRKVKKTAPAQAANTPAQAPAGPPAAHPEMQLPPEVLELGRYSKSREILAALKKIGFIEDRTRGSHHIMQGPAGQVVVPGNDNMPRGTRQSIMGQAAEALKQ